MSLPMNVKRRVYSRSQSGVALIEFAIVLPLLMLLLIGLIEIGRLSCFALLVGNAAHAGAQYGSINLKNAQDSAGITAAATADGQNKISALNVSQAQTVCACWINSANSPTTPTHALCGLPCSSGGRSVMYVQVTVQGTINALYNYTPLGLPTSWIITRSAILPVSQAQS